MRPEGTHFLCIVLYVVIYILKSRGPAESICRLRRCLCLLLLSPTTKLIACDSPPQHKMIVMTGVLHSFVKYSLQSTYSCCHNHPTPSHKLSSLATHILPTGSGRSHVFSSKDDTVMLWPI
jgi:hypothetical protein